MTYRIENLQAGDVIVEGVHGAQRKGHPVVGQETFFTVDLQITAGLPHEGFTVVYTYPYKPETPDEVKKFTPRVVELTYYDADLKKQVRAIPT